MLVDLDREIFLLADVSTEELENAALLSTNVDELPELVSGALVDFTTSGPKAIVHMHVEKATELAFLVAELECRRAES